MRKWFVSSGTVRLAALAANQPLCDGRLRRRYRLRLFLFRLLYGLGLLDGFLFRLLLYGLGLLKGFLFRPLYGLGLLKGFLFSLRRRTGLSLRGVDAGSTGVVILDDHADHHLPALVSTRFRYLFAARLCAACSAAGEHQTVKKKLAQPAPALRAPAAGDVRRINHRALEAHRHPQEQLAAHDAVEVALVANA